MCEALPVAASHTRAVLSEFFKLVDEDQNPIGAELLVENASNHFIKGDRSTGQESGELAGCLQQINFALCWL